MKVPDTDALYEVVAKMLEKNEDLVYNFLLQKDCSVQD